MNKLPKKPRNDNLYKAILKLETFDECVRFFEDLCTRAELMAMEQRFQVADCLNQGMIYPCCTAAAAMPLSSTA